MVFDRVFGATQRTGVTKPCCKRWIRPEASPHSRRRIVQAGQVTVRPTWLNAMEDWPPKTWILRSKIESEWPLPSVIRSLIAIENGVSKPERKSPQWPPWASRLGQPGLSGNLNRVASSDSIPNCSRIARRRSAALRFFWPVYFAMMSSFFRLCSQPTSSVTVTW